MPLYVFRCQSCGDRFEILVNLSDSLPETCEACGGALKKEIHPPAIQFKGSGWYVTDYAKKRDSGSSSGPPKSSGDQKESKKDS